MITNVEEFKHPLIYIAGINQTMEGCQPSRTAERIMQEVEAYIEELEPRCLSMLLGEDVAQSIDEQDALIAKIKEKTPTIIARYVYFYYSRDKMTANTIAGEKIKNAEYSTNAAPTARLVRVWNAMVDDVLQFVSEASESIEFCPAFDSEIFHRINIYGL